MFAQKSVFQAGGRKVSWNERSFGLAGERSNRMKDACLVMRVGRGQ